MKKQKAADKKAGEGKVLKMTREELRQAMMVCISTLQKLNGQMPGPEELYIALGAEYKTVLAEYLMNHAGRMCVAAVS